MTTLVVDRDKLIEKLKELRERKDGRGFVAKEWQQYYFQEPTYSIKYLRD